MAEAWLADAPDNGGAPVEPGEGPEGMSSALATVPSQRLVVLGEPGSGKSVLAVRFTLERLADRASGDPCPWFSLWPDGSPNGSACGTGWPSTFAPPIPELPGPASCWRLAWC